MRFEIDKDARSQYTWRLRAENHLIIANGESYVAKHDCQAAIQLVRGSRWDQFTIYQDQASQWRWRMRAENGEIVAKSSEGYWNKADCENAARLTFGANASTPVVDQTLAMR